MRFQITLLRGNQEIEIRLQSNLITGQSRNRNTSSMLNLLRANQEI